MQHRHLLFVSLALAGLVAVAPPVAAQTSFFDIEAGFQWLDISGNEDMYRTQDNQGDGFTINGLSIYVVDAAGEVGAFDTLRIDAAGFGGSPAGRFRLTSELADIYRLTLQVHQYDHYSALPGWANPFVGDGIVPGEHTWDRSRRMFDLELEIFPGRVLTPIVGLRRNRIDGPRRTTYSVGGDEFRLDSDTEETEEEFRVGLAFRSGKWSGAVIQGWRDFESQQITSLTTGAGGGNSPNPLLGIDPSAASIGQTIHTEAETPVTSLHVTGGFGDRVSLDASYVRADSDGDSMTSENVVGSLVSFRIGRFFESLEQSVASRTENPSWRGAVRVGVDLAPKVTLDLSYERRHREIEGWALISDLYLGTVSFALTDPRDVADLIEINNGYQRDDDIASLAVRANDLGPFFVWAEGSMIDTTLDVSQDVGEIVIPGGQSGSFDRGIDSIEVGAGVDLGSLRLLLDYQSSDADNAIVRTDFLNRSRVRGRVDWHPTGWLRLLGTVETIEADNERPDIGLDAETDHWAVDLELQPLDPLTFRLAWDRYTTDSTTVIRRPETLGLDASVHSEDGELIEGSIQWQVSSVSLSGGYSSLSNDGVLPFRLDRVFGRIGVDLGKSWGAAIEYATTEYQEDNLALADFDADRVGVFVRWRN